MTTKELINPRVGVLTTMVLLAALSRILPHPMNFAPIGAMGLFGAAYFSNRILALVLPLLSLWISDLVLMNVKYAADHAQFVWIYGGFYWQYGAFILNTLLGWALLKKVNVLNILSASLLSAMLFFIITNFGVWYRGTMYSQDIAGLMTCFTIAIPYFQNSIAGNLVYATILFGGFELMKNRVVALQEA